MDLSNQLETLAEALIHIDENFSNYQLLEKSGGKSGNYKKK